MMSDPITARAPSYSPRPASNLRSLVSMIDDGLVDIDGQVQSQVNKKAEDKTVSEDKRLDQLVVSSNVPLFKLSSVFPFDFFPNHITIEPSQINIVISAFLSDRRLSFAYDDISDVFVDQTIFFACLKIIDKHFGQNSVEINFLKRNDALRARRIIQGLIVANREKVNLAGMNAGVLLKKIEDIGKMHGIE